MFITGCTSLLQLSSSSVPLQREEEVANSSLEMRNVELPENFFNKEKAKALFFEKQQIQNSSFSFAEFFSFIQGNPLLVGSFANHLCIESISYKDIDFKVQVKDIDTAIQLTEDFFKDKNIQGTFVKFISGGKDPSDINANTRLTFSIGGKEIDVDIVLVQKKRRETLFDGFGFQLETFNGEEGQIIPCVLKGNEKSFNLEDLLELKENFLKLELKITEPTLCNLAVLRRSVEAFSKGYFLNIETRQQVTDSFFASMDVQGEGYEGTSFSMAIQQKIVEPLQEGEENFIAKLEARFAFLMNTIFLFLESSKKEERYKEEGLFRKSVIKCFEQIYKRLKLSDKIFSKHPIFKHLQRFHPKASERWTHLLSEIALQYFTKGIALKGVKISFKEEGEALFVSMAFSQKSTFWFKLDKLTEEQDQEIKSYLAHHLPQDLFEKEGVPPFPQVQKFEKDDSKVYERVLLKAKQPQVFSWYGARALESFVSDSFILFLIEKGITLFQGKERAHFFETILQKLEKPEKKSEDRERLLNFLRSKGEKTETSFLQFLEKINPFLFDNLDDLSPNFWLSFLETQEESAFKNNLAILWPKVSQINQKEIACTFFPLWKEKLELVLSPFLAQLEEHSVPLSEEEKKILKPFRVQELQKEGQQQNSSKKYSMAKGDERYSQFLKMPISQKTSNFQQFLSFVKQDKTKAGSLLFNTGMKEFWKENPGLAAQYISQTCNISLLKESENFIEILFNINPKIIYYLFQHQQWALSISEAPLLMNSSFLSFFKELAFTVLLNNEKYKEATLSLRTWGSKLNTKPISKNLAEKWDTFDLTNPEVFSCLSSLLSLMSKQETSDRKENEHSVNSVIKKIVTKKTSKVKVLQQVVPFLKEIESLLEQSFISRELKKEIYGKIYNQNVEKIFQKPLEENDLNILFDPLRGKYLSKNNLELGFKNGPFKVKLKIAKNYREKIDDTFVHETIEKLIQNKVFHEALELFIVYSSDKEEPKEAFLTFTNWKKIIKNEENEERLFQALGLYNRVKDYQLDPFIDLLKELFPKITSSKKILIFIIQIPGLGEKSSVYELIEKLLKSISENDLTEEEQQRINQFLEVLLPVCYKSKKKLIDAFIKEEILLKGQPSKVNFQYLQKVPFYASPFLEFFKEKWSKIEDEQLALLVFLFMNNSEYIQSNINIWRKAFTQVSKRGSREKMSYIYSLQMLSRDIKHNYCSTEREDHFKSYLKEVLPKILEWENIPFSSVAPLASPYPADVLPYIKPILDLRNKEKFWSYGGNASSGFWSTTVSCLVAIQQSKALKKEYESFLSKALFSSDSTFFREMISTKPGLSAKNQLIVLGNLYMNGCFSRRLKQAMDSRLNRIEEAFSLLLRRYQLGEEETDLEEIDSDSKFMTELLFITLLFNPPYFLAAKKILETTSTNPVYITVPTGMSYHCYEVFLQKIQNREPVMVDVLKSIRTNQSRIIEFLNTTFSLENVTGSIKNGKSLQQINAQLVDVLKLILDERFTSSYSEEISKWAFVANPNTVLPVQKEVFEGLNLVQSFLMIHKSFANKKQYTAEEETRIRHYIIEEISSGPNWQFIKETEGETVFWLTITKPLFQFISKDPSIFTFWFSEIYQRFTSNKYQVKAGEEITTLFEVPEIDTLADWLEFGLTFLKSLLKPSPLEGNFLESKDPLFNKSVAVNNFKEFLKDMGVFYIKSIQHIIENEEEITSIDLEKFKKFHDIIISAFDPLRAQSKDLFVAIFNNWIYQIISGNLIRDPDVNVDLFLPILTGEFAPPSEKEREMAILSFEGDLEKSIEQTGKRVALANDIKESFIRTGREYPEQLKEKNPPIYSQCPLETKLDVDEGSFLHQILGHVSQL